MLLHLINGSDIEEVRDWSSIYSINSYFTLPSSSSNIFNFSSTTFISSNSVNAPCLAVNYVEERFAVKERRWSRLTCFHALRGRARHFTPFSTPSEYFLQGIKFRSGRNGIGNLPCWISLSVNMVSSNSRICTNQIVPSFLDQLCVVWMCVLPIQSRRVTVILVSQSTTSQFSLNNFFSLLHLLISPSSLINFISFHCFLSFTFKLSILNRFRANLDCPRRRLTECQLWERPPILTFTSTHFISFILCVWYREVDFELLFLVM